MLLQILFGLPFLVSHPVAYISRAFNLGHVFIHFWSVNFKFILEQVFVSKGLAIFLLLAHLILLASFAHHGWCNYIYFLLRERHSVIGSDGASGKLPPKPIIYFQTWRIGIVFFFLGNCLNFISFGYATQSLLAALGSVQFVSNIAFAYFVLNKMVTVKVLVATAFIVLENIFLVAFGNHQSHGEESFCLLYQDKISDLIGLI